MASKFSSEKPSGSIFWWQAAQVGCARCASSCWRSGASAPTLASSSRGTPAGGSGGGAFSTFSRIHLPRSTGEVRVAYDDTVSTLAWVRIAAAAACRELDAPELRALHARRCRSAAPAAR